MKIEEYLRFHGSSKGEVISNLETIIGIADTDVLLAAGSLSEGLGTKKSDLDLILITDRLLDTIGDGYDVAFSLGSALVDVKRISFTDVNVLIARLSTWASCAWDVSDSSRFSHAERVLLHRLCSGEIWKTNQTSVRGNWFRPELRDLLLLKLQVARHTAKTLQVDMVGYQDSKDYRTLVFTTHKLLGHAIDALLAGYGKENPISKWRNRLLECVPDNWELELCCRSSGLKAIDLYWLLQHIPRLPDEDALKYSDSVSAFARAVFFWAEQKFMSSVNRTYEKRPLAKDDKIRLPVLLFDIDFSWGDAQAKLARINEFGEVLELDEVEFKLALLFDGVTTVDEASQWVLGDLEPMQGRARVHALIARLSSAGFVSLEINIDRSNHLSGDLPGIGREYG